MRSSTPKHLHPLLGRRMVDWVLAAARPLSPDRLVVIASPDTRDAFERRRRRRPGAAARDRGRGPLPRARRSATSAGDLLVLSGDTPLVTPRAARRPRSRRTAARTLRRRCSRSSPPSRATTAGSSAATTGASARSSRRSTRRRSSSRSRECNSSIYVFRAEQLWPALERLQPANAQGELYLTDAVRDLVDGGHVVAAHVAADPAETEGVNTRAELAAAAADAARPDQSRGTCSPVSRSSTQRRRGSSPTSSSSPTASCIPSRSCAGRRGSRPAPRSARTRSPIDAEIGAHAIIGPFCYLRPGTVLEAQAKAGTFVEIKNSHIGERTKVPHLSYIGDADIGEDTNIAASNVTVNFAHQPGRPKGRTTIGSNVRTGVDNAFVAPVTIGDDAWIAAGSVITEDVPPGALAARALAPGQQGRARWKPGRLSRPCPGSRSRPRATDMSVGRCARR